MDTNRSCAIIKLWREKAFRAFGFPIRLSRLPKIEAIRNMIDNESKTNEERIKDLEETIVLLLLAIVVQWAVFIPLSVR